MACSTTIYACPVAHRTRFILRPNKGAPSGYLDHLSGEDAFRAIRGVDLQTSRQRANERLRRLREAEAAEARAYQEEAAAENEYLNATWWNRD